MAKLPFLGRFFGNTTEARGEVISEVAMASNPNAALLQIFGAIDGGKIVVTKEKALTVPAVWCAANFIPATLSALPLHHFKKTKDGSQKQDSAETELFNEYASDRMTAYELRKWCWTRTMIEGRGLVWIEKTSTGKPVGLHPMAPSRTTIGLDRGRMKYEFKDDRGHTTTFDQDEVIDIPYMLKEDGVGHYAPIDKCKDAIRAGLASVLYGGKMFENGGMPPFAITGPFSSPEGAKSAADDIAQVAQEAFNKQKPAVALPAGHELKQIAIDPNKMLMVEFQRFVIEEVARIYQLPPVFLQDLSRGTFANTEQQDLTLAKHLVTQWATQFEQQISLKFFGRQTSRRGNRDYFKHNLSGLMRGDFAARMEGLAKSIQNGIMTPNEARALEGFPAKDAGNDLMIQGATVPIGTQPGLVAEPGGE